MSYQGQTIIFQKPTFYYETFDDWKHNWNPFNLEKPKKLSKANPEEYKKMHVEIIRSEQLKGDLFTKLSHLFLITSIAITAIALMSYPELKSTAGFTLMKAGLCFVGSMCCYFNAKKIQNIGQDSFILNETQCTRFTYAKTFTNS